MTITQIQGGGTGSQIKSGTITNTEIASGAAIALTKLAEAVVQADGGQALTGNLPFGGNKGTGAADGTADSDLATVGQARNFAQAKDRKDGVDFATAVAGTLASSFENGDSVDGVTLVTGMRGLIKDQGTASENGIYTINASGPPTRATDADSSAKVTSGMSTWVRLGANANTEWTLNTADPIVLGTTALAFVQTGASTSVVAGDGLTLTGDTLDVVAGDDSILVGANDLAVQLADDSLETTAGGLRVKPGTDGQLYLVVDGVATPVTLSGDATIAESGVITVAAAILKEADVVTRETPTGTVNGSNAAFVLAATPSSGSEEVFLNGMLQEPGGEDYTLSTATITFVGAPPLNSRIRVNYRK